MPDPAQIVLDEARTKYDRMERRLDDLRTRAAGILGAAAVVTGLFGFRLGTHHSAMHRTFLVLALIAFAVVAGLVLSINWPVSSKLTTTKTRPRRTTPPVGMGRWTDGTNVETWVNRVPAAANPDAFGLALALELTKAQKWNEHYTVTPRMTWFRWSCAALGIEVLCWVVAVGF